MMTNTNTATKSKTVLVDCGKCSGSGRYYFHGGSDICFPCEGTGKIRMSAARHAKMIADAARHAESYRAYHELERTEQGIEQAAYELASDMIAADGIEGARAYFRAHRASYARLGGLIIAMRDAGMQEEANAVVRFRSAMAVRDAVTL